MIQQHVRILLAALLLPVALCVPGMRGTAQTIDNTYRFRVGDHFMVTKTWFSNSASSGEQDTVHQRIHCRVDSVGANGVARLIVRDAEEASEKHFPIPIDKGTLAVTVSSKGIPSTTTVITETDAMRIRREATGQALLVPQINAAGAFIMSHILPVRSGPTTLKRSSAWSHKASASSLPTSWRVSSITATSYVLTSTRTEVDRKATIATTQTFTFDRATGVPIYLTTTQRVTMNGKTVASVLREDVRWTLLPKQ